MGLLVDLEGVSEVVLMVVGLVVVLGLVRVRRRMWVCC